MFSCKVCNTWFAAAFRATQLIETPPFQNHCFRCHKWAPKVTCVEHWLSCCAWERMTMRENTKCGMPSCSDDMSWPLSFKNIKSRAASELPKPRLLMQHLWLSISCVIIVPHNLICSRPRNQSPFQDPSHSKPLFPVAPASSQNNAS